MNKRIGETPKGSPRSPIRNLIDKIGFPLWIASVTGFGIQCLAKNHDGMLLYAVLGALGYLLALLALMFD